ncbi:MAG: Cys-tRNA(Pro) deacylase [Cyanobacteria bacterium P01_D01_bin.1]
MKTNAVRAIDTLGIAYDLLTYDVDPDDLTATTTAQKLHLPTDQVFKTLVVNGNRHGTALAVIPSNHQLDLKALAKVSGDRHVKTVPLKQVQPLTGYIRGGVTALACKKPYPVFLDEWAQLYEQIAVSAGMRGLMIMLRTEDYIRATSATVSQISSETD